MEIIYIDEDVRASREDYLQVSCKACFHLQDIPKPPRNEDLTIYQCVRCEEVNKIRHNSGQWRRAQFISGCVWRLVIVMCMFFVLGAVGWVTWLFL